MKRVKAGSEEIARVKVKPEQTVVLRVKTNETTQESTQVERVKPKTERVYNGGFIKDEKTGMFFKKGEFYKLIDGCYFRCWEDGNIKDQRTDTHVCWFGKITRKATEEQLREAAIAVQKAMIRAFPEMYYDVKTGERVNPAGEDGLCIRRKLI